MNLEDASGRSDRPLLNLQLAVKKINAVREATMQMGAQIVVNARTDVYLLPGGNPDADYSEVLRRLAAFREAGADCVFVPGLRIQHDRQVGTSSTVPTQHSRGRGRPPPFLN